MYNPVSVLAIFLPASGWGPAAPSRAGEPQGADAARRVVATLQLAAQEYRLAFRGTALVNPAEAEEALLFVQAARGSARQLPVALAAELEPRLASLELLLARHGPGDSPALPARGIE